MFITVATIVCMGRICDIPKDLGHKITINSEQIIAVEDYWYYWNNEAHYENIILKPNKDATKINGCLIKMNTGEYLHMDIPCDTTRARLVKRCKN